MQNYVSFLRGVNVGGRIIKMAELVACYESLGLVDVKSYLQSGNLSFKTTATDNSVLCKELQLATAAMFNYPGKTFVLKKTELELIVGNYPFDKTKTQFQHYIIFLGEGLSSQLYNLGIAVESDIDKLALGQNVLYWQVPKGMTLKSPFSRLLSKQQFKDYNTVRNINTLAKILV